MSGPPQCLSPFRAVPLLSAMSSAARQSHLRLKEGRAAGRQGALGLGDAGEREGGRGEGRRGGGLGRLSAGFGIGALEEAGPEDEDVYDAQIGGSAAAGRLTRMLQRNGTWLGDERALMDRCESVCNW